MHVEVLVQISKCVGTIARVLGAIEKGVNRCVRENELETEFPLCRASCRSRNLARTPTFHLITKNRLLVRKKGSTAEQVEKPSKKSGRERVELVCNELGGLFERRFVGNALFSLRY